MRLYLALLVAVWRALLGAAGHADQPRTQGAALAYIASEGGGGSSVSGAGAEARLLVRTSDGAEVGPGGHLDASGAPELGAEEGSQGRRKRQLARVPLPWRAAEGERGGRRRRLARKPPVKVIKRKVVKVRRKKASPPKKPPPAKTTKSPPVSKKQPPPKPAPKGQQTPPAKPARPLPPPAKKGLPPPAKKGPPPKKAPPVAKKGPPPLSRNPPPRAKAPGRQSPPPKAAPGRSPPPPAKVLVHPGDAAKLLQAAALWKGSVDAFQLLGTWGAARPCEDWYGVTCDGATGRVTRLNLTGDAQQGSGGRRPAMFGLSGPLPSQLGQLPALQALGLGNNFLNGTLPGQLGQLKSLEILDLGSNLLSGSIPSGLGSLKNLTSLRVSSNQISGPLPIQLGRLAALQSAFLDDNRLTGGVPAALGALKALQVLHLQNNRLNGSLPVQLGLLSSLQELVLSSNSLAGSLPSELGALSRLTRVHLASNLLAGPLPAGLSRLTRLKELSLFQNFFSGLPLQLSSLVSLSYLNLAMTSLDGRFPPALARLRSLRHLDASSCGISGPIPEEVSSMTALTLLTLASNRLTGSIPAGVGSLRSLRSLSLRANSLLQGSIPEGFSKLVALESLDLSRCSLRGLIPTGLGSLSRLTSLSLRANALTGALPNEIAQRVPRIELQDNRLSGPLPPALLLTLAFLPSDLSSVSDLGVFLSGNFLNGSCPNYTSSCSSPSACAALSAAVAGALKGNCLQGCQYKPSFSVPQRPAAVCAQACGSGAPSGPCGGQGTCSFAGPNLAPTCRCSAPFFPPPTSPGTCVLPPNTTRRPPPPPRKKGPTLAQGVSFATAAPLSGLNRWSRYLSTGYRPQLAGGGLFPTWAVPAKSLGMAPSSAFLGSTAPASSNSSSRLSWTFVRDQGACGASWAASATDAVGAAAALANPTTAGKVLELSSSQVLSCSAGGKSGKCTGDFPTTAFEYTKGTGLLLNSSFQAGAACAPLAKAPPPQIVMYEAVQYRGWLGLLLTLQKQPALVILEASPRFQNETCADSTLVYQDPGCYTGSLGHTVLVVGYDLTALTPYWVIRNSWGPAWCRGGYMRVGIQGGDGVCGMNLLPAYYPIAAPQPKDPCYTKSAAPGGASSPALSPCGGGTCKPAPQWGPYGYTCSCPLGFVAVNNTVKVALPGAGLGVTQACAPVDVCGKALNTPCGVGTCVNDGKGSYSCLCPPGTAEASYTDGTRTCALPQGAAKAGQAPARQLLRPGVSCCALSAALRIPLPQLKRQNPGLNCAALVPGRFLNVSTPAPSPSCAATYTVSSPNATWDAIANTVLRPYDGRARGITPQELQRLNPTAGCGPLVKGQAVCIREGAWPGPQVCTQEYRMQAGDTCQSITDAFFPFDPSAFYSLNPGIDCGALADPGFPSTVGPSGVTVCLGASPLGAPKCPSGYAPYYTQLGDNCQSLAASRDRFHFKSLGQIEAVNRKLTGFRCFGKIPQGSLVCHPVK